MKNENAYVIYLIKDIDDNESKIIKVSLIYVLFVSLGIVTAAISGLDNRFSFTHVLDGGNSSLHSVVGTSSLKAATGSILTCQAKKAIVRSYE